MVKVNGRIWVIGQRLADGVALQEDMQLVGVADVAPTLSIKAQGRECHIIYTMHWLIIRSSLTMQEFCIRNPGGTG